MPAGTSSYGYRGQIDDLARMPDLAVRARFAAAVAAGQPPTLRLPAVRRPTCRL